MRHLAELAEAIQSWATAEDRVRALLWYGTRVIGAASAFSDLDAALLHRGDADEVVASLRDHLGSRVRESVRPGRRGEAVLWVDEALTKIDLRLAAHPDELWGMATSPDVPAPRFVAAIDKDGACAALLREAIEHRVRDHAAVVEAEIDKFLVGFDAASNAHRRSDGYRFYFEYNLALHRLARLVEITRGSGSYLFLPRMLLSRHLSMPEQLDFRDLHGVLYLPDAAKKKRALAETFLRFAEELHARAPLHREVRAMRAFLESIQRRDLFFNVRDFADAFGGRVKHGRLFRTSALTRWINTPELDRWLTTNAIVKVLDFRDPAEAASTLPYPADLAQRLDVTCLPLSANSNIPAADRRSPTGEDYHRSFVAHIANVVSGIRILSLPRTGAVAVHCHLGRDRTGWFCAVLGLLLGCREEEVVDDYLRSGQETKEATIREFVARVAADGGVERVLGDAGLTRAEIQRLRCQLLAE